MVVNEAITLGRDCEAIQIPSGIRLTLSAGTRVRLAQSLGGTYTVMTETGLLARIAGKDADAIGQEILPSSTGGAGVVAEEPVEKLVWDQLKMCFDPEIPVNIVELGLVYRCQFTPLPEGGNRVELRFTLTAPGCGMGDVLKRDIESKLRSVPGVIEADIQVVFDPPWNPSLMSEAAKLQLGLM
jgi:probable FeS assembly SUF system protein SufT